jgi:hypothetical protein
VEENINDTDYEVENLELATSYTLKIVAENEDGVTGVEVNFETLNPEDYDIRLIAENLIGSYTEEITYSYDSELRLKESDVNMGEGSTRYVYDSNGNFSQQHWSSGTYGSESVYMTVEDGLVVSFRYSDCADCSQYPPETWFYTFNSPTSYTVEHIDEWNSTTVSFNEVELELNPDKTVKRYDRFNVTNQTLYSLSFEYNNGNLTRITNNGTGADRVFVFDDQKNRYGIACFAQPGLVYPRYFHPASQFMPQMYLHVNANNIIEEYLDGNLVKKESFVYDELGFPIQKLNSSMEVVHEYFYTYFEK